ncbi:MAG: hypothetical protein WDA74_06350 [Spirochaetota bacterium]
MVKKKVIYSAYITLRNGRRLYARHYGKKAFRFEVEEKKEPKQDEDKAQE